MKFVVKILDIIIASYFVIVALVYGIVPIVGLFANGTWWDEFLNIQPWWARIILLIIILGWLYAPYYLMQKAEAKYNYCLAVLVGIGLGYQIFKYVILDNYVYTGISDNYLAFFILPIILILVTYYLHHISLNRQN